MSEIVQLPPTNDNTTEIKEKTKNPKRVSAGIERCRSKKIKLN